MRRRHFAAALAATGMLLAGGLAYADPFHDPPTEVDGRAPVDTVTLTSGDRVHFLSGGVLEYEPAPGREDIGFLMPESGQTGERFVIPMDLGGELAAGNLDTRLFNVDALRRGGFDDAAAVSSAGSLGAGLALADTAAESAAAQTTVKMLWRDGTVPKSGLMWVVNLDTNERELTGTDESGTVALELAPGRYGFAAVMDDGAGEVISAFADTDITDEAAQITIDGRTAEPIEFTVDRPDAQFQGMEYSAAIYLAGGDMAGAMTFQLGADAKTFAIPSAVTGHEAGLTLRPYFTNPSDQSADPYAYRLVETTTGGIPEDLGFTVHDEDLAVRHATYNDLGGTSTVMRYDYGKHSGGRNSGVVIAPSFLEVPSERTEYYTADPEVTWTHTARQTTEDDSITQRTGYKGGSYAAGEGADMNWFAAPVSVGVAQEQPFYGSGVARITDGKNDSLAGLLPLFESGDPGQYTLDESLPGTVVLSQGGKEVASGTDAANFGFALPAGSAGRYELAVDAVREVPWTDLGTRSSATWDFALPEGSANGVPVTMSAVRFDASGVVNGYAKAGQSQDVTLEYLTQYGAPQQLCTDMTFEVSYDEGKTWSKVDIDRDGNSATGLVESPADAGSVSVKFTATDEAGNTVTHSTIRSYGLR